MGTVRSNAMAHRFSNVDAAQAALPIFRSAAVTPMDTTPIEYRETLDVPLEPLLELYRANGWSSADKPDALRAGLRNSHALRTAWHGQRLVGVANTLSDGHLVVYYSHILVHPDYRGRGIGTELMRRLQTRYRDFHQQVLLADGDAVEFFQRCGFQRAGRTEPMWIFHGREH